MISIKVWPIVMVAAAALTSQAYAQSKKRKAPTKVAKPEPRVLLFTPDSADARPKALVFGRLPDTVSDAPILLMEGKDGKIEAKQVITDPAETE